VPQGNVLIVQEKTVETVPEASFDGGMILFSFQEEAQVIYEVVLLNIETSATINVVYDGGKRKDIDVTGLGRNSVQTVPINLERVSSVLVIQTGPGAVASIRGCFGPGTKPPSVPSTPAPSFEDTAPPTAEPVTDAPVVSPPTIGTQPTPVVTPPTPVTQPTPVVTPPTQQRPTPPPVDGCVEDTVTFDTYSDGTTIPGGTYVDDEWLATHGFSLGAMGGTGDFPRILDTSQENGALGRYV
jgi:hypothetical protein